MKTRSFSVRWRDRLLFPLALLFVVLEAVFQGAAQLLLAGLANLPGMARANAFVAALPAFVVLPLFLVPEVISHLAGFLAAMLLSRGQFLAAVALAVIVKGGATLATVWIYQAAAPTLLGVPWFARGHGWVVAAKAWTLLQLVPARQALSRYWREHQPAPFSFAGRSIRRFRAMRARLAVWLDSRGIL